MEVRRHFIEQDKYRLVAVEKVEPGFFIGGFGAGFGELAEYGGLAELRGDFTPEVVGGAVAPVEGGDLGISKAVLMRDVADQFGAIPGIFRQQAEADHEVGLATTHCLLEVEDRVVRLPCEAGDAFFQQVAHAASDEGFFEILRGIRLADDLVELFDLVPDGDFEGVGL